MTATQDMDRMTARLVDEALADVLAKAERQEIASRVYRVPQEAVDERLRQMDESPEMPCWPVYDLWTRPTR